MHSPLAGAILKELGHCLHLFIHLDHKFYKPDKYISHYKTNMSWGNNSEQDAEKVRWVTVICSHFNYQFKHHICATVTEKN
jgi:fatty acid desaturase